MKDLISSSQKNIIAKLFSKSKPTADEIVDVVNEVAATRPDPVRAVISILKNNKLDERDKRDLVISELNQGIVTRQNRAVFLRCLSPKLKIDKLLVLIHAIAGDEDET